MTLINRKRLSEIKQKIIYAKRENRMGRCFLKSLEGDTINVGLAAAGSPQVAAAIAVRVAGVAETVDARSYIDL